MRALHYSGVALVRRCGMMLLAAAIVLADDWMHHGIGVSHVMGLNVVASATMLATAGYLTIVTMVLTLALARHGAVALAQDDDGIALHSAWHTRQFAWNELAHVALEVRQTKFTRFYAVALHLGEGIQRRFSIDTRLLVETIDDAGGWADRAEQARLAHGGAPFIAPDSGFNGWLADRQAAQVVAARQASRA